MLLYRFFKIFFLIAYKFLYIGTFLNTKNNNFQVDVGNGSFEVPLKDSHLASGAYLSLMERLQVRLVTGEKPRGEGFMAHYQAVSKSLDISREIDLNNE